MLRAGVETDQLRKADSQEIGIGIRQIECALRFRAEGEKMADPVCEIDPAILQNADRSTAYERNCPEDFFVRVIFGRICISLGSIRRHPSSGFCLHEPDRHIRQEHQPSGLFTGDRQALLDRTVEFKGIPRILRTDLAKGLRTQIQNDITEVFAVQEWTPAVDLQTVHRRTAVISEETVVAWSIR